MVRSRRCSFIFIGLFMIIYLISSQLSRASLYGIWNIFTMNFKSPINDDRSHHSDDYLRLKSFMTRESELIETKLKIFFLQTSDNVDLLPRHACSIESAARLHPNGSIFVLMRSPLLDTKDRSYALLRVYSNIYFLHYTEEDVYTGTELQKLMRIHRRQFLRYFSISHTSDFIRTALLYKYGGIYFDLDVIPLRSFQSLRNTVALESSDSVNVAVLALEKSHPVLRLQMNLQLQSINQQFQAFCWSCFGPLALTRALTSLCNEDRLPMHARDKCHQIDIQPSFVFYPMSYEEIPEFFYSSSSIDPLNILQNTSIYSIHYFHHMTMNIPIEMQSPFAQIAHLTCPRLSNQLIDQPTFIAAFTPLQILSISFFIVFFMFSLCSIRTRRMWRIIRKAKQ